MIFYDNRAIIERQISYIRNRNKFVRKSIELTIKLFDIENLSDVWFT